MGGRPAWTTQGRHRLAKKQHWARFVQRSWTVQAEDYRSRAPTARVKARQNVVFSTWVPRGHQQWTTQCRRLLPQQSFLLETCWCVGLQPQVPTEDLPSPWSGGCAFVSMRLLPHCALYLWHVWVVLHAHWDTGLFCLQQSRPAVIRSPHWPVSGLGFEHHLTADSSPSSKISSHLNT